MILTGPQIDEERKLGNIALEPFNPKFLGPNSYDVTLHPYLLVYIVEKGEGEEAGSFLDMKKNNPTKTIQIPDKGLILEPNQLYIGCTNECATSSKFVPMFEGRSSIGRLGINTHITAGFGDVGWGYSQNENGEVICYNPTWTLEIAVVHRVKVYPNVRIGQVYFMVPKGTLQFYSGKYSKQKAPQASQLFKDFE